MVDAPKPFDIDAAAQNLRRRREEQRLERARLHEAAARDAAAIIGMIRRDYDPVRIYQWGSVLNPRQFNENSDIDIAVEGIRSAKDFFEMTGKATAMTRFPIDIVEFDKLDDLSRASILDRGTVVYERS